MLFNDFDLPPSGEEGRVQDSHHQQPITPSKNREYDPLSVPADWNKAFIHRQSTCVGEPIGKETCPCCANPIYKNKVPMACLPESISFLGSGYPLYFHFLQQVIILFLIQIISMGQFGTICNYMLNKCDGVGLCSTQWITKLATLNRSHTSDYIEIYDILSFSSCIVTLIYLWVMRRRFYQVDIMYDIEENTAGDYTIYYSNLPLNIHSPYQLKEYLKQLTNHITEKLVIRHIDPVYDISTLLQIGDSAQELMKERRSLSDKVLLAQNHSMIIRLQREKNNFLHQHKLWSFAGSAFVGYRKEKMKKAILNEALVNDLGVVMEDACNLSCLSQRWLAGGDGRRVGVMNAPEPQDVNWVSISRKEGTTSIISTLVYYLLLMALIVSVLMSGHIQGQLFLQAGQVDELEDLTAQGGVSILIVLFNFTLVPLLVGAISTDEGVSITNTRIPKAYKINHLSLIIALLLITLMSKHIQALISMVTLFLITWSLCGPLCVLINVSDLYTQWRLAQYRKQGLECTLTQMELNRLMSKPDHPIEQRYAFVVSNVILTWMYGLLVPLGYFITVVGLCILYWVEKYSVLRLRSINACPSLELTMQMTALLQYLPLLSSLQVFLFRLAATPKFPVLAAIQVLLTTIFLMLPHKRIVDVLWHQKEQDETIIYDQKNFPSTYQGTSPFYTKKTICKKKRRDTQSDNKIEGENIENHRAKVRTQLKKLHNQLHKQQIKFEVHDKESD